MDDEAGGCTNVSFCFVAYSYVSFKVLVAEFLQLARVCQNLDHSLTLLRMVPIQEKHFCISVESQNQGIVRVGKDLTII